MIRLCHVLIETVLSNCEYIDFVNRVLLLRDRSCLQRFRMKCYEYYRESVINSWIATALLCNVEELDLAFPVKDPILLPSDIFLCKTLVVLKLDTRSYVNMPSSVCLPVLKTLHLSKVELSDDISVASLLCGCPVLEELRLSRCIGEDVHIINIVASSFTSLTIDTLPCDSEELINDCNYQIVIDTPALKYLNIKDYAAQGYVIKDLNHLIKADINVGNLDEEVEFVGNLKPIADLFTGISQVQSLVLSWQTMEAICSSDFALPTFNNLKYMKIGSMHNQDSVYHCHWAWSYLLKLLRNSLYLETLDLPLGNHYDYLSDRPTAMPPCFLSHLKVIKIREFKGLESEKEMVEYFVRNGKALEKLTIDYDYETYNTRGDEAFFEKLLMMTRSSTFCKVEVL